MPALTVIIPCRNHASWIGAAISSCLRNTRPPEQIIVVNDASTDGFDEAVHPFKSRIEVISHAVEKGAGAARNTGLRAAQGEFIQFLDADDVIFPQKLERHLAVAREKGADFVYGNWKYLLALHRWLVLPGPPIAAPALADFTFEIFASRRWVPAAAWLFRAEFLREVGAWSETIKINEDAEFLIRCVARARLLARVDYVGFGYRRFTTPSRSIPTLDPVARSALYAKVFIAQSELLRPIAGEAAAKAKRYLEEKADYVLRNLPEKRTRPLMLDMLCSLAKRWKHFLRVRHPVETSQF